MGKKSKQKKNINRQKQYQARQQTKFTTQQDINVRKNDEKSSNLSEDVECLSLKVNSDMSIKSDIHLSVRPSGLGNLGNTCYFNSTLQIMGQTYILYNILKESCKEDSIWNARTFYLNEKENRRYFVSEMLNLKLPPPTSLAKIFLDLLSEIFSQRRTNPGKLLYEIRKENSQFEGYQQQDAQELLITLLGILKKNESNRQKLALIEGLRIENKKNPTNEDKEKANRYKITANHTVIDAIFGGQLLSIIHCTVCDYRSFTFEPFIDLALSLKTQDNSKKNIDLVSNKVKFKPNKNFNKFNCTKNESSDEENEEMVLSDSINADDKENEPVKKISKKERKELRKKRNQAKKLLRLKKNNDISETNDLVMSEHESTEEINRDFHENNETQNLVLHKDDVVENNNASGLDSFDDNSVMKQMEVTDQNSDFQSDIIEEKEILNNGYISDNNDKDEIKDMNLSSIPSKHCLTQIDQDFRYKFYVYAHQRMCYSDDDYQNLDLGTLLRNFIKEETLDGANKYLCENCSKINFGKKIYSKAVRCQLIALPPPILIIQLKRFEASGAFGKRTVASMHKLDSRITFPEKLYIAPYTSQIYKYFSKFYEPEFDSFDITSDNINRLEYTLYGVILHSGGLRSGHYMAYVCVRPGSFDCQSLKRFLHLKPFVSNIEHILQVAHEDFHRNGENFVENSNESDMISEKEKSMDYDISGDLNESNLNESNQNSESHWYFISDSSVSPTNLKSVLNDCVRPYLLFYERTN